MTKSRPITRATGIAGLTGALIGALVFLPAGPSAALHQYCGAAAEGVHLGGYPQATTLDNGHPNGSEGDSYAGVSAVGKAKEVALGIHQTGAFVGALASMYDTMSFDAPNKAVKLAFSITSLALEIASTIAESVVLHLEQQVAEVDACNDVMAGDTIDLIFVAKLQRELASLDPADGSAHNPTGLFLLPDDGSPQWTQFAPKYTDRSGHADLQIPFIDGFANTDHVGVAEVVRNAIAHLDAHGLETGTQWVWADGELKRLDGAKELWWDAMRLLEDGRVRLAYAKFGEAYRLAVMPGTTS